MVAHGRIERRGRPRYTQTSTTVRTSSSRQCCGRRLPGYISGRLAVGGTEVVIIHSRSRSAESRSTGPSCSSLGCVQSLPIFHTLIWR